MGRFGPARPRLVEHKVTWKLKIVFPFFTLRARERRCARTAGRRANKVSCLASDMNRVWSASRHFVVGRQLLAASAANGLSWACARPTRIVDNRNYTQLGYIYDPAARAHDA